MVDRSSFFGSSNLHGFAGLGDFAGDMPPRKVKAKAVPLTEEQRALDFQGIVVHDGLWRLLVLDGPIPVYTALFDGRRQGTWLDKQAFGLYLAGSKHENLEFMRIVSMLPELPADALAARCDAGAPIGVPAPPRLFKSVARNPTRGFMPRP